MRGAAAAGRRAPVRVGAARPRSSRATRSASGPDGARAASRSSSRPTQCSTASLAAILWNTLALGLADYSKIDADGALSERGSWRNALLASTDLACSILFVVEAAVKLLAMGVGPEGAGAYLRDGWCVLIKHAPVSAHLASGDSVLPPSRRNVLDGTVVLSSVAEWCGLGAGGGGLAALRALRALRPLRRCAARRPRASSSRRCSAVPGLGSVIMILAFAFVIFAIAGVQLFSGRATTAAGSRPSPSPPTGPARTPTRKAGPRFRGRAGRARNDAAAWNFDTLGGDEARVWSKRGSPWATRRRGLLLAGRPRRLPRVRARRQLGRRAPPRRVRVRRRRDGLAGRAARALVRLQL